MCEVLLFEAEKDVKDAPQGQEHVTKGRICIFSSLQNPKFQETRITVLFLS